MMKEKYPFKVSVCVVTYNHQAYIAECLDSILAQKRNFGLEILIHDDASTDGAQAVIQQYHSRYPDIIRPILRTENQYSQGKVNITGLFNIPRTSGKYVAVLDGDDYWCDPGKLQRQVDYMEAHPDCVFTFHAARVVDEKGQRLQGTSMRPYHGDRELSGAELVGRTGGIPFASFLLRRDILLPLPAYYFQCPVGDRPLELIAAAHGRAFYFDAEMSVYRFSHAGSWTSSQLSGDYREKQERYAREMAETYRLFDEETGGRFHSEARAAADRIRFLTAVNVRDFREIYRKENRSFLRELSRRDRFFIGFEHRLPGAYRLLQKKFGTGH